MTRRLQVDPGAVPWLPNKRAQLSTVLRRYDHPLAGVVTDKRQDYLFQCIAGEGDELNFWIYTPLTYDERAVLETSTAEARFGLRMGLSRRRPAVVAVASEGDGILSLLEVAHVEDYDRIESWLVELIERLEQQEAAEAMRRVAAHRPPPPRAMVSARPLEEHEGGEGGTESLRRWLELTAIGG